MLNMIAKRLIQKMLVYFFDTKINQYLKEFTLEET